MNFDGLNALMTALQSSESYDLIDVLIAYLPRNKITSSLILEDSHGYNTLHHVIRFKTVSWLRQIISYIPYDQMFDALMQSTPTGFNSLYLALLADTEKFHTLVTKIPVERRLDSFLDTDSTGKENIIIQVIGHSDDSLLTKNVLDYLTPPDQVRAIISTQKDCYNGLNLAIGNPEGTLDRVDILLKILETHDTAALYDAVIFRTGDVRFSNSVSQAVHNCNADVLELLISKLPEYQKAAAVFDTNYHEEHAFILAARAKKHCMRMLVALFSCLNQPNQIDQVFSRLSSNKFSVVKYAVKCASYAEVKYLLDFLSPPDQHRIVLQLDKVGLNCIHSAMMKDCYSDELLNCLFDAIIGQQCKDDVILNSNTLFHCNLIQVAIIEGLQLSSIKILLKNLDERKLSEAIYAKGSFNRDALGVAEKNNRDDVIEYLKNTLETQNN